MSHVGRVKLFGGALERTVEVIQPALGNADAKRLAILVPLFLDEHTSIGICLRELFPGYSDYDALVRFRQFREALGKASVKSKLDFSLVVDSQKRTKPAQRKCWFEGRNPTTEEIEKLTRASVRVASGMPVVRQQAVPGFIPPKLTGKQQVKMFISFADVDEADVMDLIKRLKSHFSSSKRYEVKTWIFRENIPCGNKTDQEIQQELEQSTIALFMASPSAFGRDYIITKELPKILKKLFIPVCLKPFVWERCDMHGVEERWLFRMKKGKGFKCYNELTAKDKDAFALNLFKAVEEKLDTYFMLGRQTMPKPKALTLKGELTEIDEIDDGERLSNALLLCPKSAKYVRAKALAASLQHGPRGDQEEKGEDAVAFLEKWVLSKDEPPFCAVLGEYGIGKTTTLQFFSRSLLEKRKKIKKTPLPIYIDLRLYQGKLDPIPSLEQILDEIINRSWKQQGRPALRADGIIRAVQEQGALIIFDGLDEKIVHLQPSGARAFIRELWKALPHSMAEDAKKKGGAPIGRMIVSCRSHYFRDLVSQTAMLTGEDREGIYPDTHYRALFLIPFTDEQIREYLADVSGLAGHVDQTMEMIGSIHNLTDLAKRPYLLSLISGQISELEKMRAAGRAVQAVDLYDLIVKKWLARDDGKHQIGVPHKRLLMEHLAVAMWRDGTRLWEVEKLENWLDEFLAANTAIERAYADKPREVLKEDLRTSTFVLRPDTEEKSFRFAHTSMQEYFLACRLVAALRERRFDEWALPKPSRESFDFFGQLLRNEKDQRAFEGMRQLLETNRPQATLNGFHYWIQAVQAGHPRPSAVAPDLRSENLEGVEVCGLDKTGSLNLAGINLEGAWLPRIRFENVNISGARLKGCAAQQAEFLNVIADDVDASHADLTASVWRDCSVERIRFNGTELRGSQWIRPSSINGRMHAVCGLVGKRTDYRLDCSNGHYSSINSVAWSPDGTRVVSGSADKTVRVWDAKTGREQLMLEGHQDGVLTVGWSLEGTHIMSGSGDKTVRVWDTKMSQKQLTLEGHQDGVSAIGWSPDGSRIVSGSNDRTVRVWDAKTCREKLMLEGHKGDVVTVAFSPDGNRIASGSNDRYVTWYPDGTSTVSVSKDHNVRVWDAKTGRLQISLEGHQRSICSVGWSPDGSRLVSGSDDQTVRVWDAKTGRLQLTLKGHQGSVCSVGWSPDGSRLVSGSDDQTVRVWDASTGKTKFILEGHKSQVRAVAWSPDSTRIVSGSSDTTLKFWDAASGKALLLLKGYEDLVSIVDWSPDGSRIIVGFGGNDLMVFDTTSGRHLLALKGHKNCVSSASWSPDGSRIVSGSWDRTARIWDACSGRLLLVFEEHGDYISSTIWSPDGSKILSGSWANPIRVWDAHSGKLIKTFDGHFEPVNIAVWSPDGTRIASGSDDDDGDNLIVHDTRSSEILFKLKGHKKNVYSLAWSPDGTRILSGSVDKTIIWDANTGKPLTTIEGNNQWSIVAAWSPDSSRIVSESNHENLKVWNANTGNLLFSLEGQKRSVCATAWSRDGTQIFSGSTDNTIGVWDAVTGKEISTLFLFKDNESALLNLSENRVLAASPGAWRYLRWRRHDEVTGEVSILPSEYFGPLPSVALSVESGHVRKK